jgi:hypothetical protein
MVAVAFGLTANHFGLLVSTRCAGAAAFKIGSHAKA